MTVWQQGYKHIFLWAPAHIVTVKTVALCHQCTCCSKPSAVDLSVMTDFADLTARTNSFSGASKLPISCSDCFCSHAGQLYTLFTRALCMLALQASVVTLLLDIWC